MQAWRTFMNRPSLACYASIFAAAIASLATGAPPPDWTLDDESSGDLVLEPGTEEATFRMRVKAVATSASLAIEVDLDPPPARPKELADTPIALFLGYPTDVTTSTPDAGAPASGGYRAVPYASSPRISVDASLDVRVYEVRVRWESPDEGDRSASRLVREGESSRTETVLRPLAPRRRTNIRWRAKLHAEGYDDRPAGALIDVEPSP